MCSDAFDISWVGVSKIKRIYEEHHQHILLHSTKKTFKIL